MSAGTPYSAAAPDAVQDDGTRLLLLDTADDALAGAAARTVARMRRWGGDAPTRCIRAGLLGLDPLSCFESAPDPATPGGIVLLAEVAQQCDELTLPGLPWRDHVLSVAQRNGWELADCADVGPAMQRHWQALMHRARIDPAWQPAGLPTLPPLETLIATRLQALQNGRVAALLMRFVHRAGVAPVRRIGADSAEAVRTLFGKVFGHAMSAAQWDWKYGQGRGCAVGIEQDGALVAHYGGQARPLRVLGRPAMGCQMCDVMVDPGANRSLVRRGPMHRMTASFLETQLGWGQRHLVGFGFPSDRHNELARRLGLYMTVDRLVQCSWPALAPPERREWRMQDLGGAARRCSAGERRVADTLWRKMAAQTTDLVLGERGAEWIEWRYLQAPHAHYTVTLVCSRWMRRPLGLFVTRLRDDALELLDLVAPPRDFPVLVQQARQRAAELGRTTLRAWVTQSHQGLLVTDTGATVDALPICIPANTHTPGPDPRELENRWFLMGGDADFT